MSLIEILVPRLKLGHKTMWMKDLRKRELYKMNSQPEIMPCSSKLHMGLVKGPLES